MEAKMIKCCFCGKEVESVRANSARPLRNGLCCTRCNNDKVIPYRIMLCCATRHSGK